MEHDTSRDSSSADGPSPENAPATFPRTPWVQEEATGRLPMTLENEYDQIERRYSSNLSGTSYRERSMNQQANNPSLVSPRSETSTQFPPRSNSNYAADTTTEQRPRGNFPAMRTELDSPYDSAQYNDPRSLQETNGPPHILVGTEQIDTNPREPLSGNPAIGKHHVAATDGDIEPLDDSYKVRNFDWQKFFRPGRVFSTLWTDAFASTANDSENNQFMSNVSYVIYKERVHSKIRRFIVVRLGDRCCTCLPVTTYDGRGSRKRGINLNEHGLIFSSEKKPNSVKGIEKVPLRVRLSKGAERLNNPSYINYGRVYTVETNVKVKDIGELDSESRKYLRAYYNQVNTLPDADYDGPGPTHTPQARAVELPGVGFSAIFKHLDPTNTISHDANNMSEPGRNSYNVHPLSSSQNQSYSSYTSYNSSGPQYQSNSLVNNTHLQRDEEFSIPSEQDNEDVYPYSAPAQKTIKMYGYGGSNSAVNEGDRGRLPWSNKPASTRESSPQSRSSSVLSASSLTSTLSSMTSSSLAHHAKGRERLISFLIQNKEIYSLCACAFQTIGSGEFSEYFRRFLIEFARELKAEASSTSMRHAARLIRQSSRTTADTISRDLETAAEVKEGKSNDGDNWRGKNENMESDFEESDSDHEKSDPDDEFGGLEESLASSTAFLNLKDNLRILANSDPVQRAILHVWPLHERRSTIVLIDYELEWNIISFMRTYYPAGQKLESVLTLTGGVVDAQALSCQEYLTMTWPKHEALLSNLLVAIESLIDGRKHVIVRHGDAKIGLRSMKTTQEISNTQISISVHASHEIHTVLLSALSWLCAAIRHSPFTEVVHSAVTVQGVTTNEGKYVKLSLNDLETIQCRQACWHELFPHAVVAKYFPIKERQQGKGLEISFSNMALMSRSTSFVEFDGGLLGQGLRTLLIPVKVLQDDGALQWHYASKKQKHSRKQGRLAGILKENNIDEWYKELRSCRLIEKRCFLGWAEKVSIIVGTEAYLDGCIRWSGVEKCSIPLFAKSENLLIDSQGLQYYRDDNSQSHMPTAAPSSISLLVDKDIPDYLDDERDTDILIYDTGSETATFLPHACVTLLLVRKIVDRRQYQLYDGRFPAALRYIESGADDGLEAIEVLTESLSLKVRKSHSRKSAPLDDFSVLVRQVLEMIETVRSGMEDAESHLVGTKSGAFVPGTLHGVELMDMVKMSRHLRIRDAAINQAWSFLGGHHSTVLFCRGLGQPIVCTQPERQCSSWLKVPPGKNFLVMTGLTLLHLLEEYADEDGNSRFSRHLEWIFPEGAIHAHRPMVDGVTHVQHVKIVQNSEFQKHICDRLLRYKNSGFIFSDARIPRQLCYETTHASISSAESNQNTTRPNMVQDALIEASDSTSDTSVDSNGSSIGEERASDSMSSEEAQHHQHLKNTSLPSLTREQHLSAPSPVSGIGPAKGQSEEINRNPKTPSKLGRRRKPQWLPGTSPLKRTVPDPQTATRKPWWWP